MILTESPKIITLPSPTCTNGISVYKRCSIEVKDGKNSDHIAVCIQKWLQSGEIELNFHCSEQELMMLELSE